MTWTTAGQPAPEDAAGTQELLEEAEVPVKTEEPPSNTTNTNTGHNYIPSKAAFEGRTPELNDNIFSIANKTQAFIKTRNEFLLYAGRKYDTDVQVALKTLTPVVVKQPAAPMKPNPDYDKTVGPSSTNSRMIEKTDDDLSVYETMMLQCKIKKYLEAEDNAKKSMSQAYFVLKGQCTDNMVQELETCVEWPVIDRTHDPIALLKALQRICFDFKQGQFPVMAELKSLQRLFRMKQRENESLTKMVERFGDLLDVAKSCGASFVGHGVRNYVANNVENQNYSKCTDAVQKRLDPAIDSLANATLFLMLAGGTNADSVRRELANEFIKGHDNYPTDMTAVRKYIVNYKDVAPIVPPKPSKPIKSLVFAQGQSPDLSTVTCRNPNCGQQGHYANSPECPIRQQEMADAAKWNELMKQKEHSDAEE